MTEETREEYVVVKPVVERKELYTIVRNIVINELGIQKSDIEKLCETRIENMFKETGFQNFLKEKVRERVNVLGKGYSPSFDGFLAQQVSIAVNSIVGEEIRAYVRKKLETEGIIGLS